MEPCIANKTYNRPLIVTTPSPPFGSSCIGNPYTFIDVIYHPLKTIFY